jgi:transposase
MSKFIPGGGRTPKKWLFWQLEKKNKEKPWILGEEAVEKWLLPHLSKGKRGFKAKVDLSKVVLLILKRLKTGCQWRELPIKEYFSAGEISWQGVYYHFNKWCNDGSWKAVWVALLKAHRGRLDLSSVQLDGSHTPAKNGGGAVGYQGRKACKTSNSLFLCDNAGQMLAVSTAQSGEHNDLYEIEALFEELTGVLQEAGIDTRGLFLNADPGFDAGALREACSGQEIEANIKENPRNKAKPDGGYTYFDEELYKRRAKIEHANA